MLIAPFTEIVLIDADTVLLQPPEDFFEDPRYLRSGALFFKDRTLMGFSRDDLRHFLIEPYSDLVKNTRIYNETSGHEMESGVMIVNKKNIFLDYWPRAG